MKEFTYKYVRKKIAGGFDVNFPSRIDIDSNKLYLAKEIERALPGKKFITRCNGLKIKIVFRDSDITAPEKAILDGILNDHRKNKQGSS